MYYVRKNALNIFWVDVFTLIEFPTKTIGMLWPPHSSRHLPRKRKKDHPSLHSSLPYLNLRLGQCCNTFLFSNSTLRLPFHKHEMQHLMQPKRKNEFNLENWKSKHVVVFLKVTTNIICDKLKMRQSMVLQP